MKSVSSSLLKKRKNEEESQKNAIFVIVTNHEIVKRTQVVNDFTVPPLK
jgi:hypothetical protein